MTNVSLSRSYDLTPCTSQKSFYGKAKVHIYADGTKLLQSYDTIVLRVYPDGRMVRSWSGWSATTGKHIRSFCGLNKAGYLALPYEW